MANPNLILVEGLPGAGKTSTTNHLQEYLRNKGVRAKAYYEFDLDNPIRSMAVDLIRHVRDLERMLDQGADGLAVNKQVYSVDQWSNLSDHLQKHQEKIILESRYWQNPFILSLGNGESEEGIVEGFKQIRNKLSELDTFLIYLKPLDVEKHTLFTVDSRPTEWSQSYIDWVNDSPWAQNRNLRGLPALIEFNKAWSHTMDLLYDQHKDAKIKVQDPQHDWDKALFEIFDEIEHSTQ